MRVVHGDDFDRKFKSDDENPITGVVRDDFSGEGYTRPEWLYREKNILGLHIGVMKY